MTNVARAPAAFDFAFPSSGLSIVSKPFPAGVVFDRIQSLSRKHGLTSYDAAYLDLALEKGLALATLDEALVRG